MKLNSKIFKRQNGYYSLRVYVPTHLRGQPHLLTKNGKPKQELVKALNTTDAKEARKLQGAVARELFSEIYRIPDPEEYRVEPGVRTGTNDQGETYEIPWHPEAHEIAEDIEQVHGTEVAVAWYQKTLGRLALEDIGEEFRNISQTRKKNINPRTLNRRLKHLAVFTDWYGSPTDDPHLVTKSVAEGFMRHLLSKSLADNTINSYLESLSSVWDTCEKYGNYRSPDNTRLDGRIWTDRRIDNPDSRNQKAPLTRQELATLATALPKADRAIADLIIVMLFTGARVEEPCLWKPEHLEYDQGKIIGVWSKVGKKKADSKRAFVPIYGDRVVNILTQRCVDKPIGDFIFNDINPPQDDGPRSNNILRRTNRWLKRTFPESGDITNHSMRKTHATAAENAGLTGDQFDRLQNRESKTLGGQIYSAGPEMNLLLEFQKMTTDKIEEWLTSPREHTE